ncbi:MAG: hypothetical protein IAA72_08775 [Spirochaetes bacterium]|uniref:Uncharacterized protein n=1 Tax=Candidatus Ornithospirochaeta stercoravium TaxID=2840897 RepID=A0A9D9NDK1_9SPIO|nr:hypothetical protein [Candidatus Ornithospirochaeta stercoravium]
MTDATLDFGLISLGSSAAGYSANCIDFEVEKEDLSNLSNAVLVIVANGAVSNAALALYSGAADNPTTKLGGGYPTITAMADGERIELELPLTCSRYLRVGGTGTGKVTAHIEMGGKSA